MSGAAELWRLLRFAAVGGAATLTHLGVATTLLLSGAPLPVLAINLIAYLCAFGVSLVGHQRVTFRRRARLPHFMAMSLGGYLGNNLLLLASLAFGAPPLAAVTFATLTTAALTYLVARQWVFRVDYP